MADDGSTLIADQTQWFQEQCLSLGGVSGGIYAVKPGFHYTVNGNLAKYPGNYSIALPILLAGPRNCARATDWTFPEAQTKNFFRINLYSSRMDVASRARDPRLKGLYEWFGTRDGANIGWNIYKDRFSSSDDTHDWHMHFSWVTAYLLNWAGPQGAISVLRGETLAAYLARGGRLIGQGQGTGAVDDMYPEMIFGQASQLAAKVQFDMNKYNGVFEPNGIFDEATYQGLVSMGVCSRGRIFQGQEMSALDWIMGQHAARSVAPAPSPGPGGLVPHTHTFDPAAGQSGPAQPA